MFKNNSFARFAVLTIHSGFEQLIMQAIENEESFRKCVETIRQLRRMIMDGDETFRQGEELVLQTDEETRQAEAQVIQAVEDVRRTLDAEATESVTSRHVASTLNAKWLLTIFLSGFACLTLAIWLSSA